MLFTGTRYFAKLFSVFKESLSLCMDVIYFYGLPVRYFYRLFLGSVDWNVFNLQRALKLLLTVFKPFISRWFNSFVPMPTTLPRAPTMQAMQAVRYPLPEPTSRALIPGFRWSFRSSDNKGKYGVWIKKYSELQHTTKLSFFLKLCRSNSWYLYLYAQVHSPTHVRDWQFKGEAGPILLVELLHRTLQLFASLDCLGTKDSIANTLNQPLPILPTPPSQKKGVIIDLGCWKRTKSCSFSLPSPR